MKIQFIKSALLFSILSISMSGIAQDNEPTPKTNVKTITNAAELIMQLDPITYNYNSNKKTETVLPASTQYGFATEEIKSSKPELIKEDTKFYSQGKNNAKALKIDQVDNEKIIPILVAALKEQQEQIDLLKKEISSLKK